MIHKPKARLKVTLRCNKTCKYCINKNKEYRNKWTTISHVSKIDWSKYRSVIISGGEPTLCHDLDDILTYIRDATPQPIYLQTNGLLLKKDYVKLIDNLIDGIGISVHDVKNFEHLYIRFKDILKVKPIKLYIQDKLAEYHNNLIDKWEKDGFSVRIWHEGEFDNTEEILVLNDRI